VVGVFKGSIAGKDRVFM